MSRFCSNCGASLEDDAVFCPECGVRADGSIPENGSAPAGGEPSAEDFADAASAPEPAVQAEPAPAPEPAAENAPERSREISTAGYFWLMLLYHIPFLGFIAMLIFGLSASNRNLRNYARAHLVWIIVMILLFVLLYVVTRIILRAAGVEIDWETLFQNIRNLVPVN